MLKINTVLKNEINLPTIVIGIGMLVALYHLFSYLLPLTNNAFIVTNTTPIAADVSGYITKIYVANGQAVKKGTPLIRVYQKPYRLAYDYAKANYEEAIEHITLIERRTNKTNDLLAAAALDYERIQLIYRTKNNSTVKNAVPSLNIKALNYKRLAMKKKMDALQKQIAIENQDIVKQGKRVAALKAAKDAAWVNLKLTTVKAPSDGVIDNLYISTGTPIKIHDPLFSFIDTSTWWVQANFDETDLRHIKPGDEALIILRMYYFDRVFHGRIVNTLWAANRQETAKRSQQQTVTNQNQWVLVPQRLPIQIKILDPDPHYPFHPGASAYVYLKAHTSHRNV